MNQLRAQHDGILRRLADLPDQRRLERWQLAVEQILGSLNDGLKFAADALEQQYGKPVIACLVEDSAPVADSSRFPLDMKRGDPLVMRCQVCAENISALLGFVRTPGLQMPETFYHFRGDCRACGATQDNKITLDGEGHIIEVEITAKRKAK